MTSPARKQLAAVRCHQCLPAERTDGIYAAKIKDSRDAWFSTPSRVKRPWEEVWAAVINAVALGRLVFGHI